MTFFEHQQQARKKTGLLVFYFVLAIVLIILAINVVIYLAIAQSVAPPFAVSEWIEKPYWFWISGATLLLIGMGTLHTIFKLRGGGRAVAEIVGARKINQNTANLNERKLINVVEEMSIASGTPVPTIYVLDDESSINAFVAGLRPTETVLVVTRGTLVTLSRDELQGVIAHEYSHILNGDMRINIRLMGILAGILIIGQMGRILLRSTGRSSGKNSSQAALIGLALFIIGYIGLFFGALIKAAISRQREFLADASAVQFTRNPDGIAGALWKIKNHVSGSLLNNSHSDDISHFCISESVKVGFTSLLATHPPLDLRIKAINPHFDPKKILEKKQGQKEGDNKTGIEKKEFDTSQDSLKAAMPVNATAESIVNNVGNISSENIGFAALLLAAIPGPIESAVHQPAGARQVVYALLLGASAEKYHEKGHQLIRKAETEIFGTSVNALIQPIKALGAKARLPLLNMTIPVLKEMSQDVREQFLDISEAIIKLDNRFSIFEFALFNILQKHLVEDSNKDVAVKYFKFRDVEEEIKLLLSVIARVSSGDKGQILDAYQRSMKQFIPEPGEPVIANKYNLDTLNSALHKLNMVTPLIKQSVIQACSDCVIYDGKVNPAELDILQAVAISLDCPMPPLLDER